jgi:HK97 family phage major capsid protein/HK97 family phage prohead protease
MKQRMFSVLTIKSFDEGERIIEGLATTPATDRMEDQVVPSGAKFALPIPLIWQHDANQPIGTVIEATVTDAGIWIRAKLAQTEEAGTLKNRLDEAWQSIKLGLVRGLSIGFRGLEVARIEGSFGLKFLSWEWLELSPVTIPANAEASIQTIKSFDEQQQRATTGQSLPPPVVRLTDPGASGSNTDIHPKPQEGQMKTVREQIEGYTNMRAAKAARMNEIMQKSADEGRTLSETESQEYDAAEGEVGSIDAHLVRLTTLEKSQVTNATRVNVQVGNEQGNGIDIRRGADIVNLKSNLPKGTGFTRLAIALMRAKGNLMQAHEISKGWDESTPEVGRFLKAAVAAGTTTDPTWAGPLVDYQNLQGEFIELLRPATLLGRMTGLRKVPFNIKIPSQTSGATAAWVGEGAPKPVGKLGFGQITMRFKKVAGIVVMSDELVRFSNPSAEALVRDDMIATIAQLLDNSLVDPASAEVTDVKPASLTNGVTAIASSGNDADAVKADVRAVFATFIAANLSVDSAVWLMSGSTALALSEMQNPLGQAEFPGISVTGGTFKGLPALVSETVGDKLILVKQSEILLADDGQVVIDASSEASLEMADNPTGTGTLKSLWQNNLAALRAERFINWRKRRPEAVAFVSGVAYGQPEA